MLRVQFIKRAEAKVQEIDEKARTLQAVRKALIKFISECSGTGPVSECPILEALNSEDEEQ